MDLSYDFPLVKDMTYDMSVTYKYSPIIIHEETRKICVNGTWQALFFLKRNIIANYFDLNSNT